MAIIKNWNLKEQFRQSIPSTSYLTHGIHAYTAKLIPQIPRYFIEKYTTQGQVVLDPFCGSGTVLLEACLLHRNAIGIDLNPIAVLISQTKIHLLNLNELNSAIYDVRYCLQSGTQLSPVNFSNIDHWFSKQSQYELAKIRASIRTVRKDYNENIIRFLLICLSSIIRKSSYADPRMAKTYKSKRVIAKIDSGWKPTPIEYFNDAVERNVERLRDLSNFLPSNLSNVQVFQGDASQLCFLLGQKDINQVDFVLTSPPYINAQDYFRSYKFELWWLDLATPDETRQLKRQSIGTETLSGTVYTPSNDIEPELLNTICYDIWQRDKFKSSIVLKYFQAMREVFQQTHMILRENGYFCLITGNNSICQINIPTYLILSEIAKEIGFELVEIGKDKICDRLLPPNRNHSGGMINEEWITVFKKTSD